MPPSHIAIWTIAALSTAGVVLRPFGWPEAIWAVCGAGVLVGAGFLPMHDALAGAARGIDVYLFLTGMMLLSETARAAGLFDWLAAAAARRARGSPLRLFALIYAVGTVVTVFLSNDATAVVLTPAVAAVARAVRAERPAPFLFICAFIANAASFVLPISNPANLVIYADQLPPLFVWLARFGLASAVSITATYACLWLMQRRELRQAIVKEVPIPRLSPGGRAAACGIVATGIALLACSSFGLELGRPTFIAGLGTAALSLVFDRLSPWRVIARISWGVLPLVAGLFVLVQALETTGAVALLAAGIETLAKHSANLAAWSVGVGLGAACNLMNNLPAGLIAGQAIRMGSAPETVRSAALIGVDLGPNLSVTGSLATILWLSALRREGQMVSAWTFLKIGALVMPVALIATLAAVLI